MRQGIQVRAELLKAKHLEVLDNPPLESSLEGVIQPPRSTKFEHHVASWATTLFIQVFQGVNNDRGLPQWIFTPEQRDDESGKVPDFVVEQVYEDPSYAESQMAIFE